MGKLNILDVGSGPESIAAIVFGEDTGTVIRLDMDPDVHPDYVHDIIQPLPSELHDRFDVVYASHVLEHIPRMQVVEVVRNLAKALKDGGELWFVVPSLEWIAQEIYRGRYDPIVLGFIYGGQSDEYDYHKCGFTLIGLRSLLKLAGLVERKAYQSIFTMTIGEDEFQAIQNVVIGMRHDGDPALAIS